MAFIDIDIDIDIGSKCKNKHITLQQSEKPLSTLKYYTDIITQLQISLVNRSFIFLIVNAVRRWYNHAPYKGLQCSSVQTSFPHSLLHVY